MDDDNLLADYDLSAWDVPPPPAGLADAVVRRAREPGPRTIAQPRSLRRWFIASGVLAALVAVLAMVTWGIERAPKNGSGTIAAQEPRTLDLGTSSAAIDSGAQLTWSRHGTQLAVAQSRGDATWTIGKDDTVTIDAAVVSIQATGASLRVEVEMNRSDVRAVGIGSAAAIVVSLVTVIVYEGHVKATSNGQTVNIQPGASMRFGAPPPSEEQLNVGGDPKDAARIRELEKEIADLKVELEARKNLQDLRDMKDKRDKKDACDAAALTAKGDELLGNGLDAAALAQFEASLSCKADVAVSKKAFLAACRSKSEAKARTHYAELPANLSAQFAQVCVRQGIALDSPACDADALKQKGDDYLGNGMDTAALAQFEAALRCKYDAGIVKTAFLAACRSKQTAKAMLYFSKLPPTQTSNYAQICLRFGIDVYGKPATPDFSGNAKASGVIHVSSKPAANIQLDGQNIGGGSPVSMKASVGKHKITFVVDGNKYTYTVVVKAGETTTLTKDFSHD